MSCAGKILLDFGPDEWSGDFFNTIRQNPTLDPRLVSDIRLTLSDPARNRAFQRASVGELHRLASSPQPDVRAGSPLTPTTDLAGPAVYDYGLVPGLLAA